MATGLTPKPKHEPITFMPAHTLIIHYVCIGRDHWIFYSDLATWRSCCLWIWYILNNRLYKSAPTTAGHVLPPPPPPPPTSPPPPSLMSLFLWFSALSAVCGDGTHQFAGRSTHHTLPSHCICVLGSRFRFRFRFRSLLSALCFVTQLEPSVLGMSCALIYSCMCLGEECLKMWCTDIWSAFLSAGWCNGKWFLVSTRLISQWNVLVEQLFNSLKYCSCFYTFVLCWDNI